ncbi:MAG: transcriptional regulator, partial [Candidatus Rokubacteria bacterium 13_1_40CM_4_67_11]
AEEALGVAEGCAIVITDLVLPQMDGIELLQQLKEMARPPVILILTAHGTVTTAVEAMRQGAFYYLTKPVDPVQLQVLLEKSLEQASLTRELSLLRHQLKQKGTFGKLTGESKDMQEAYRWIELAATSGAPVLVYGESGTGKELVARTIHERSNRRQGPFVAINCAAIPETLIESEIFGHERGAFTGAIERRLGCFELADRGTLFLDEIAEMDVSVQAKLLRILQDNAFRRVGGREELHVDVRIIAATNRAPADALAAGKLREDLFYRLNVFPIPLPPLRQRPEDILPLARTFIEEFCAENARHVVALAPEAEKALLDYAWPGNVRELRNAVQRAVVLGEGALLTAEHLSPAILATSRPTPTAAAPRTGERIRDMERRLIVETLEHVNHDKTRAAVLLGISPKTLYNKIARYKIRSVKRSDAT